MPRAASCARCTALGYGPEVYGYLAGVLRSQDEAVDVFAMFAEDVARGLPGFRWASSFRTWAYIVARHALCRFKDQSTHEQGRVPLSDAEEHAALRQEARTLTETWSKTSVRDAMRDLRRKLDEEDRPSSSCASIGISRGETSRWLREGSRKGT